MSSLTDLFLLAIVLGACPLLALKCFRIGAQGEPLGYLLGVLLTLTVVVGILSIAGTVSIYGTVSGASSHPSSQVRRRN
ncbi:MAG: hypothetical protein K1X83_08910 [Oligoflexia bacterium]|nr:hypothetical protein [Oligoflexia bacterium]